MIIERLTQPALEPFPASTIERWCGAGIKSTTASVADDDAAILADLQHEVREYIEDILGRTLMRCTWRSIYDYEDLFYADGSQRQDLWLEMPPLVSIESVTWMTATGAVETIDSSAYWVITGEHGRFALRAGQSWPSSTPRQQACLTIESTHGYVAPRSGTATSTNTETVISGLTMSGASGKRLAVHMRAVSKGVTFTIYGSAASTFSPETLVATVPVAAGAHDEYVTPNAQYDYWRIKCVSTQTDQPGTATVEVRVGDLPSYVATAIKELCRYFYRNRGDGYITNLKTGGNVALPNHLQRVIDILRLHAVPLMG